MGDGRKNMVFYVSGGKNVVCKRVGGSKKMISRGGWREKGNTWRWMSRKNVISRLKGKTWYLGSRRSNVLISTD